ncbi:MAG: glycosyltransferase family 4 protein [bacterium]
MKKVLIISYAFPPRKAIGAQRPFKLAKYLPDYGWQPVILTPKLPGEPPKGIRVIETDYKNIKDEIKTKFGFKLEEGLHEQLGIVVTKNFNYSTWRSKIIKFIKEVIAFPDQHRYWVNFALKSALEFLSKEKVDMIISTSPPATSHIIARKLKQKYKIPWVADLRDLWTQNHYHDKFKIIKYFERRLEIKTLASADILIVVHPLIDVLKTLHNDKKIFCITNGYDKDDFSRVSTKLTDKFTITYTGTLYNGKRDPSLLFEVVESLINDRRIERDLIELRFFGCNESWLLEEIKRLNLQDIVHVYPAVPREESLKMQKESQLLLLLLWNNKDEENILHAKVFEYLGAKRPIIAYGCCQGAARNLLETTNAGKFAENKDSLKDIILQYYQEFIESREVKCKSNSKIEDYTYNTIAKKYSEILNKVILNC